MSQSAIVKTDTASNTLDASLPEVATFDYSRRLLTLTPEEKAKYLSIGQSIKLDDMSTISHYGAELSATISANGNVLLDAVKGASTNEVVNMTNDLLAELNMIDVDELNISGFKKFIRQIPILRKFVTSIETLSIKCKTISDRVEDIRQKIEATKIVALRDNGTLDTIFESNRNYIQQLRDLIIAAKLKDEEIGREIQHMVEHPEQYDACMIHDAHNFRNNLAKRITDMVTTEYILQQNLFQIRATQSNNIAIADKATVITTHIIPAWKSQIALAIINDNQRTNIEVDQKFSDTTNMILRKNAQALKINSVNVAKAAEEQVVSLDTLTATTQDLIDTIAEVRRIHSEGAKKRKQTEDAYAELGRKLEKAITEQTVAYGVG